MSGQEPAITVVVPVREEERYIARTIRYLLDQDYPRDKVEILIGVADSNDRTAEVVQGIAGRDARVKYFHNPHGLSSGARTLGVQMAAGEIVLFVDGHVHIDNDQLLRNTARLMEEKQVAILSRPQFLDTPDNSLFQQAVAFARRSLIGHGPDSTIYSTDDAYVDPSSSGACYRKEVFERVGYFDLSFDACEDVEFNYRCAQAGFRSFSSMKLAVYYYPRSSLGSLFHQMRRYGCGRYRLARKHPGTLSLGTMIPAIVTLGVPLLVLLTLMSPVPLFLLLVVLLGYAVGVGFSSLSVAASHGWRYLTVLPGIYLAIHVGLGWGFLHELGVHVTKSIVRKQKSPANRGS